MPRNKQVDTYIAKSPAFAQPILTKLRTLFHKAVPQLEEQIKWGIPSFERHGNLAMTAAFKQHVRWGFWKAKLIKGAPSMGGAKLTSVKELPPDKTIIAWTKQAAALNESGVQAPNRAKKPAPKLPRDLAAAVKKHPKAAATYKEFSPSCQREYVEWITDAKQAETRQRRIDQTIAWLSQGKKRNWKYEC
jgi:uncharacterized protein YdeI (YjbR/CyaY-like superfamily)